MTAWDIEGRRPGTVGACIYCGKISDSLEKEHIIPYGLKGQWVLPSASCRKCAQITSRFERNVLRDWLLPARAALHCPTRRPGKRPKRFPVFMTRAGVEKEIQVPIEEYPTVIPMWVFDLPGYLTGNSGSELKAIGASFITIGTISTEELTNKYGANAGIRITHQPYTVAQFIAKIAYGFSVAQFGLRNIQEAYVLPGILGVSNDLGQWVGCDQMRKLGAAKDYHSFEISTNRNEIVTRVKLFSQFDTPEYVVCVGRL